MEPDQTAPLRELMSSFIRVRSNQELEVFNVCFSFQLKGTATIMISMFYQKELYEP